MAEVRQNVGMGVSIAFFLSGQYREVQRIAMVSCAGKVFTLPPKRIEQLEFRNSAYGWWTYTPKSVKSFAERHGI
jgi:hypothetical protein